jgi:hypothetical protein
MVDALPVPAQLVAQLDKCKTVRNAAEFYKPRTKTEEVSHAHMPHRRGTVEQGTIGKDLETTVWRD